MQLLLERFKLYHQKFYLVILVFFFIINISGKALYKLLFSIVQGIINWTLAIYRGIRWLLLYILNTLKDQSLNAVKKVSQITTSKGAQGENYDENNQALDSNRVKYEEQLDRFDKEYKAQKLLDLEREKILNKMKKKKVRFDYSDNVF